MSEEWRCFHCDEVLTDRESAAIHFGTHECQRPACLIDAAEYRRMEAKEASYAAEDAAIHRQMWGMHNEHRAALRRAEEAGYAKGVRDAGSLNAVLRDSDAERAARRANHESDQ